MTVSILQVSQLNKSYVKGAKSIAVLRGVELSVEEGEAVSIVGPSGSGKSTLLHLLGTLEAPDSGTIRYKGRELTALDSPALADFRNTELGFVFQFHHLLSEFTALENVMIPALIKRLPRAEATRRARAVLSEVGLDHRLDHKPGELSGGEQQRVALARALVLDPPLLLADEVTGNLDERTGEQIHELLFALNASRGVTLLVVTHNRSLADRMPRRLLLEDGLVHNRSGGPEG